MKRAVAVAFLLALSACAGMSPTRQWANSREALTLANAAYIAASQANRIDDEQRVYYGELLQAARASIARAEALLPEGGDQFQNYLDIASAVLVKVQEHQALKGGR